MVAKRAVGHVRRDKRVFEAGRRESSRRRQECSGTFAVADVVTEHLGGSSGEHRPLRAWEAGDQLSVVSTGSRNGRAAAGDQLSVVSTGSRNGRAAAGDQLSVVSTGRRSGRAAAGGQLSVVNTGSRSYKRAAAKRDVVNAEADVAADAENDEADVAAHVENDEADVA